MFKGLARSSGNRPPYQVYSTGYSTCLCQTICHVKTGHWLLTLTIIVLCMLSFVECCLLSLVQEIKSLKSARYLQCTITRCHSNMQSRTLHHSQEWRKQRIMGSCVSTRKSPSRSSPSFQRSVSDLIVINVCNFPHCPLNEKWNSYIYGFHLMLWNEPTSIPIVETDSYLSMSIKGRGFYNYWNILTKDDRLCQGLLILMMYKTIKM